MPSDCEIGPGYVLDAPSGSPAPGPKKSSHQHCFVNNSATTAKFEILKRKMTAWSARIWIRSLSAQFKKFANLCSNAWFYRPHSITFFHTKIATAHATQADHRQSSATWCPLSTHAFSHSMSVHMWSRSYENQPSIPPSRPSLRLPILSRPSPSKGEPPLRPTLSRKAGLYFPGKDTRLNPEKIHDTGENLHRQQHSRQLHKSTFEGFRLMRGMWSAFFSFECGETTKISSSRCRKCCRMWLEAPFPRTLVQAIRGFLLGFRRGDSVTSKTRTNGKKVRSISVGESDGVCVRTENWDCVLMLCIEIQFDLVR